MSEFYENTGSYVVRVAGLGSVEALFLRSSTNADEARANAALGAQCDPRRTNIAVYRVTRLYPDGLIVGRTSVRATYLLTGIEQADRKNNLLDIFFEATSAGAANMQAKQNLRESKLYHCEPI